jgi:hypothetical protein
VNEPRTHRLLLPSEQWVRRLGFASSGEAREVNHLALDQTINAGIACDLLADDTDY